MVNGAGLQAAGAGGLQPTCSDEPTFTAQSCDVDSHNDWYKNSVRSHPLVGQSPCLYFLRYVHAATANKAIAMIQRDQSLIPVFLAMHQSYILRSRLTCSGNADSA